MVLFVCFFIFIPDEYYKVGWHPIKWSNQMWITSWMYLILKNGITDSSWIFFFLIPISRGCTERQMCRFVWRDKLRCLLTVSDDELYRRRQLLAEEEQKLRRNEDNSNKCCVCSVKYFTLKELKYAIHSVPRRNSSCLWFMLTNHSTIWVTVWKKSFQLCLRLNQSNAQLKCSCSY